MVVDDPLDPAELKEVYDQFEVEDTVENYEFVKVVNHEWRNGILYFGSCR